MSQTLTIELRDDLYRALRAAAEKSGKTPQQMGADCVAAAVERGMNDPLEEFIGAISSDVPDWADQHDKYIGQGLMEGVQGDREPGGRDA